MNSLSEVSSSLNEAVGRNAALFSLINTRLVLRSGIDLKAVRPADDRDAAKVNKALDALTALGYPRDALSAASKRKSAH